MYALLIGSLILGIICLCFSYVDITGIQAVSAAMNQTYTSTGLVPIAGIQSLNNNLSSFALFFPTLAGLMVLVMIAESWLLSFFIKASPLAAVVASANLFMYTIASFYISNIAITVARLNIFAAIVPHANLLLLIWLNAPPLLVICCVIDIAIALTASAR